MKTVGIEFHAAATSALRLFHAYTSHASSYMANEDDLDELFSA